MKNSLHTSIIGLLNTAFKTYETLFTFQDKTLQSDWSKCFRNDSRNLVQEWIDAHENSQVVRSKYELLGVSTEETDFLMGLFGQSHVAYDDLRTDEDPSIVDMTSKALEVKCRF